MAYPGPPYGPGPSVPPPAPPTPYPMPAYPPWGHVPPPPHPGIAIVNTGGTLAVLGGLVIGIGWFLPILGWEIVVGIGWLMFGSGVGLSLIGIGKALASR